MSDWWHLSKKRRSSEEKSDDRTERGGPNCRDSNNSWAGCVGPEDKEVLRNTPGRETGQMAGVPVVSAQGSSSIKGEGDP